MWASLHFTYLKCLVTFFCCGIPRDHEKMGPVFGGDQTMKLNTAWSLGWCHRIFPSEGTKQKWVEFGTKKVGINEKFVPGTPFWGAKWMGARGAHDHQPLGSYWHLCTVVKFVVFTSISGNFRSLWVRCFVFHVTRPLFWREGITYLTQPMAKLQKIFGITYLVGKISRSNFFFQGPGRLSELPFVLRKKI